MGIGRVALGVMVLVVAGCAADDPARRTKTGAAVGAVAGAILGNQVSNSTTGRVVGAAVGAVAGGMVGNYMDRQAQEFEQELADERSQHAIEIEHLRDDTLKLSLDSEVSFDFDRADLKPAFLPSLDKLADVLMKYDRTVVHVVGHTDSVGPADYNQRLSRRRAESVGRYLTERGVPAGRIRTEGRGESEPRDSNETEAGRQLNRRVEIYVKPVVEGEEQRAYEPPGYY